MWTSAPAKKPGDAPPPPPPEEKKDDGAGEEEEEEQFYEFMGHRFKVPQLKMPQIPDWLRVILEFRFPSSIDPYTGEIIWSTVFVRL